jgi:S1-C subfamily serine protease
MNREHLIIGVALLAVSTMAQEPESLSPSLSSITNQRGRIVRLARKKEDGFHFVGTGFVVTHSERTYIVTCAHVVDNPSDTEPLYADFPYPLNAHPTTVAAKNYDADLAVLATDVPILPGGPETTDEARKGMRVFVVGFDELHMQKDNPQIQSGVVATMGWWEERKNRVFTSKRTTASAATPALLIYGPMCQPGASGSPVFGPGGQIVGVTTSFTHDHNCLATSMPALVDLLEQIEQFD